jgi:hypothetical protein
MDDILESVDNKSKEVPQVVKTLSILAYVGNGFWGLMILILMLMVMSNASFFEDLVGVSLPLGALYGAMFVIIVLCALSIVGANYMSKGRKSGFWIYAIANGIWALLLLPSGEPSNIGIAAISIGFIIGFGAQLKNLN